MDSVYRKFNHCKKSAIKRTTYRLRANLFALHWNQRKTAKQELDLCLTHKQAKKFGLLLSQIAQCTSVLIVLVHSWATNWVVLSSYVSKYFNSLLFANPFF